MRTLIIIGLGLLLLGLFLACAHRLRSGHQSSTARAALAFLPMWFGITLYNVWIGVSRAGYSWAEELPILAVTFGIPATAAIVAWHRTKRK